MVCIWELHKTTYALNCAGTCNCNLQHDTCKAHLPKKTSKNRRDCEPYDGKHIMCILHVDPEISVAMQKKKKIVEKLQGDICIMTICWEWDYVYRLRNSIHFIFICYCTV